MDDEVSGYLKHYCPRGYSIQGVMLYMSSRNTNVSRGLLKFLSRGDS